MRTPFSYFKYKSIFLLTALALLTACSAPAAPGAGGGSGADSSASSKPTQAGSAGPAEPTETPTVRAELEDFGPAPELENEVWLNTDEPLRLENLRGKVVLLDMWTFG